MPPVFTDLDAFVAATDPAWGWSSVAQRTLPATGCREHELQLTSQRWRGELWRHRLWCLLPAAHGPAGLALLQIGGSGAHTEDLGRLAALAQVLRAPAALLADVPNQPLFDGLREDALIAYTFDQFLQTGDPSWPLLCPMTKAAVRAMDALQAFVFAATGTRVAGFVVTGASKRGWTAWLTAAVDRRVRAVVPAVYDNLDLPAQLRRQRQVFPGGCSDQLADYAARGLLTRLEEDAGRTLVQLVDPFAYRARLTQPKWLLLGTNDPYWPVDALSLYYDRLPAPTYVTYVPNAGHGLEGGEARIRAALLGAWAACGPAPIAPAADRGGPPGPAVPCLAWQTEVRAGARRVLVTGPRQARAASLWQAEATDGGFAGARWTATSLRAAGPPWSVTVTTAPARPRAFFVEVETPHPDGLGALSLDTPIWTVGEATVRPGAPP